MYIDYLDILLAMNAPTSFISNFFENFISKTPTPEIQILKSESESKNPAVSTEKEDIFEYGNIRYSFLLPVSP